MWEGEDMNTTPNQDNKGSLEIYNVYLKDFSFEAPSSPHIFTGDGKPKIELNLEMATAILSEEHHIYEIVLHITATSTLGEEKEKAKPVFQIDMLQAGAFVLKGYTEEGLKRVLATTCAGMIYPYAREVISSMANRGGFPPLHVPPIDFEAMYENHLNSVQTP